MTLTLAYSGALRREPGRDGPLRRDSVAKNGYPLPLSEPEKNSSTPPPTGTLRGCCSACARTGASRASWTSAAARPSIAARRATGEKDGRGRRRLAEGGPGAARRRRERERECTTSRTRAGASGRRRSGVRGRVGPERPSREGPPVGTAASPRGCLWACVWAGRRREGEGAPRGGRAARRGVRRRDAARLRPKDQEARVLQAAGRPLTSESVRPRPRRAWSSSARGSFALIASLAAHIVWQYVPSSSRTLRDLGGADGAAKRTCGDLRNRGWNRTPGGSSGSAFELGSWGTSRAQYRALITRCVNSVRHHPSARPHPAPGEGPRGLAAEDSARRRASRRKRGSRVWPRT